MDANNSGAKFEELLKVIAALRDPETGCPWDIKQTHESLRTYVVEEAYELIEAIDSGEGIAEELGDVLLQIVLHSRIAEEAGNFSATDVVTKLTEKLIDRHPHVFGDEDAETEEDVAKIWSKKKAREDGVLAGVPKHMPALEKATLIGRKVGQVGFDWPDASGALAKVKEELAEVEAEIANGNTASVEEELGDLLFSIAQLTRKLKANPERLLRSACDKFTERFKRLEKEIEGDIADLTLEQLEEIWQAVKIVD